MERAEIIDKLTTAIDKEMTRYIADYNGVLLGISWAQSEKLARLAHGIMEECNGKA